MDARMDPRMDLTALLALQIDWGADEALLEAPVDRLEARPPQTAPERRAPAPGRVAVAFPAAPSAPATVVAAETLDAWRQAVRNFTGCALRETATNPVLAEGDPGAGLMVIGEPPGAEEDRAGRPFMGPAGAVLDRILASLAMPREQMLLAPLIPWRPPGNRPPTDAELAQCLPLLHRLIALTKPRWVVLTGILPVRALLGQGASLRRVRGRWTDLSVPDSAISVRALAMPSLANLKTSADRRDVWVYWRMLHHEIRVKSL